MVVAEKSSGGTNDFLNSKNQHLPMKNQHHTGPITLALCLSFSLTSAQELILEDTFENRTIGAPLDPRSDSAHHTPSSDGRAFWIVHYDGRDGVVIDSLDPHRASPTQAVVQSSTGKPTHLRFRMVGDLGSSVQIVNGIFQFDYYYLSAFDDNTSIVFNYRLPEDFNTPFTGGIVPGYQLSLKALNSTTPDSIRYEIRTDRDSEDSKPLATGSVDLPNLVVGAKGQSGENEAGIPVAIKLELEGDRQILTINGTKVADFRDDSQRGSGGAFNFLLNATRNRAIDNVRVSKLP